MSSHEKPTCFQDVILTLSEYWSQNGCAVLQPYDMEVGAGTFHPATTLRALGPRPWAAAYPQPSRRPTDGRYGENPNRLQHYYQYQVLIKPSPPDLQDLYLGSLSAIGVDLTAHDVRFVEDDWESPTLGAWGLGWEVWCDGMEVSQFTYFQQVGGFDCDPIPGELTYGLERLAMYVFGIDNVYDLPYSRGGMKYGDVFLQTEQEYSRWNFEVADTDMLFAHFEDAEAECGRIIAAGEEDGRHMAHPAYDQCVKASHIFNLLDARGVISVTERQAYIGRVRTLAKMCAETFLKTPAGAPSMPELLLEFFSEEIPARMQRRACADLGRMMGARMTEAGLAYETLKTYATPRRLTLWATGLPAATPDVTEERRGPRIDAPDRAIEGFLRAAGVPKDKLEIREDAKGPVFFAKIHHAGRPATDVLAEMIEEVARNFPWPKSMRWGTGRLRWVRPLHSVLCVFGEPGGPASIVPVKLDDIPVGDATRGHRFMAPQPFAVTDFLDYKDKLAKAYVVLDAADRVTRIRSAMAQLANQKNLELLDDDLLLQEVAGLVEWPTPILGAVDPEFQDLPPEVLQTSMREHQKFFSLRDPETRKICAFITIANIRATDAGERIQAGNERVLKARLADAQFFWSNDLAAPLDHMAARLENVVFHAKLGDQTDRISRVRGLAAEISDRLGAKAGLCDRAAELAKADLVSDMVYEFPELQGIMGRYYALAAGEPPEVAEAVAKHYKPVGASDSAPRDETSIVVALADRLDMLTCFWVIDEKPTGSRDPFALRRAALGAIRIAMENNLALPLRPLIEQHYFLAKRAQQNVYFSSQGEEGLIGRNLAIRVLDRLYEDDSQAARDAASLGRDPAWGDVVDAWRAESREITDDLLAFMADRMAVYLREEEGWRHDVVQAVLSGGLNDVASAGARVRALSAFIETAEGANLMAGYRRAANIVAVEEKKDGVVYDAPPDVSILRDPAEEALLHALQDIERAAKTAFTQGQYEAALAFLARLRGPLDEFFENVVVNAPDSRLRAARLQLLSRVCGALNITADLSYLEG